jgi:CDP-diacylglycerol--serine O-phosphatidyltransferase
MTDRRRLRRGLYLLPTLFTVGNLFCGFSSMVLAAEGAFANAALLIILAGILDGLDGRIARLTGASSEFGREFDSLADIVSFGVAPALLAYHWALSPIARLGWLIAFVFVVCAAARLARFNLVSSRGQRRHFTGLPSPAAAGAVASTAFSFPQAGTTAPGWVVLLLGLLVLTVGLLMVSRFRYRSFKEFDLKSRRSYIFVLPITAMLVAIGTFPRVALALFATMYTVSAPLLVVWNALRRKGSDEMQPGEADTAVSPDRIEGGGGPPGVAR